MSVYRTIGPLVLVSVLKWIFKLSKYSEYDVYISLTLSVSRAGGLAPLSRYAE